MSAIEDGQFPRLERLDTMGCETELEPDFYCKEELVINESQIETDNQLKITDLHSAIVGPVEKASATEVSDKGIQCEIEDQMPASKKSKSLLYAKLFDTTEEKIDIMLEIYGSYDKIFEKLEHRLNK